VFGGVDSDCCDADDANVVIDRSRLDAELRELCNESRVSCNEPRAQCNEPRVSWNEARVSCDGIGARFDARFSVGGV
jgi:hypothetical protein